MRVTQAGKHVGILLQCIKFLSPRRLQTMHHIGGLSTSAILKIMT